MASETPSNQAVVHEIQEELAKLNKETEELSKRRQEEMERSMMALREMDDTRDIIRNDPPSDTACRTIFMDIWAYMNHINSSHELKGKVKDAVTKMLNATMEDQREIVHHMFSMIPGLLVDMYYTPEDAEQ